MDSRIEIWQPRWHDRVVLIGKHKVKPGENKIVFTKAKNLPGSYFMEDTEIKKYPLDSNGKIPCFAVPLDVVLSRTSARL